MMEDMIGGPASSIASHCASKLGGLTSPASDGTSAPSCRENAGPHLLRRSDAWAAIGNPKIELKAAVSPRTHV